MVSGMRRGLSTFVYLPPFLMNSLAYPESIMRDAASPWRVVPSVVYLMFRPSICGADAALGVDQLVEVGSVRVGSGVGPSAKDFGELAFVQ